MEQEVSIRGGSQITPQKYCAQCGASASLEARFCQSCGLDLVAVSSLASGMSGTDEAPSAAAEDLEPEEASSEITLQTAWIIYAVALLVWIGTLVWSVGPLFLPIYLVSGFIMTRMVMRKLIEFHPVYNTVANVFSAKLWMFLLWPLQMGILLFKLTFNRVM